MNKTIEDIAADLRRQREKLEAQLSEATSAAGEQILQKLQELRERAEKLRQRTGKE